MGEKAVLHRKDQVWYYTFPLLSETGLTEHAFSTRKGGISEGCFASMNLSARSGDSPENVRRNLSIFCEALGWDPARIVASNQTHSTAVKEVTEKDRGRGVFLPGFTEDADALITNTPGLILMTFYADCVPVYLLDPVNRAIGLVHSGWRGTDRCIAQKTVEAMEERYQSDPADLLAVIAPSICENCYEVSEELYQKFDEAFAGASVAKQRNGRFFLHLQQAVKETLMESGLQEPHIADAGICTCCSSDLLFSHRASKGKRGLLAAMFSIKEHHA